MPITKLLRTVLGLGRSETESSGSTDVTAEPGSEDEGETSDVEIEVEDGADAETGPESPVGASVDADESAGDATAEADTDEGEGIAEADTEDTEAAGTDEDIETVTDEAVAAETDASGSTGSIVEEPDEPAAAVEPAKAAADVSDHAGADTAADETAEAAGPVPETPDEGAEPVESISGIGPAYAKRLGEVGIETVPELVDADPDELAEQTDLSAKRISRWQERAETL